MWLTPKEFRRKYNIYPQQLYQLKIHNRIKMKDDPSGTYLVWDENNNDCDERNVAIYARVRSKDQQDELDIQIKELVDYANQHHLSVVHTFYDTLPAINDNRNGFNGLIQQILNKGIKKVLIADKDRIGRFGYGYFNDLCNKHDVEIIVTNKMRKDELHKELMEDFIHIVNKFSNECDGSVKYQFKRAIDMLKVREGFYTEPDEEGESAE